MTEEKREELIIAHSWIEEAFLHLAYEEIICTDDARELAEKLGNALVLLEKDFKERGIELPKED